MKTALFLSNKFIKSHKRQCIGIVLTVSIFLSAFITTLIFRESFRATIEYGYTQIFGKDTGVIYNVDPNEIEK
ncbi:MAG: hypothetical protein LBI03_01940, partial [Clostridiales bacterium]|nr:hypothetical protein [Clostridiales bacterium]